MWTSEEVMKEGLKRTFMISTNKNHAKAFIYKTETNSQVFKNQTYGYQRGNRIGEGQIGRVGITQTHDCVKQRINKLLLSVVCNNLYGEKRVDTCVCVYIYTHTYIYNRFTLLYT